MKTKRNMTFKPKTNSNFLDLVVVIVSLTVISLDLFLFVKELNRTFERMDTPIATIEYKYKTVQRKFNDRAVWDRPVQNSYLYNGDTIRTANEASATIHFLGNEDAGNVVEVDSNTMVQIFAKNEESELNLNSGSVSAKTANNNLHLKSDNADINIEKGSVLHVQKGDAESLQLAVEEGSVSVTGSTSGETEVLEAGSVLQQGEAAKLVMISPGKNTRLLNQSRDDLGIDIKFKWQSSFSGNEEIFLETSPLSNFSVDTKRYDVRGLKEFTVKHDSGALHWRLSAKAGAESEETVSGKVTVIKAPAPVNLLPEAEKTFAYNTNPPHIRFLWEGNELSSYYTVEIADNKEMNNPKVVKNSSTESFSLSELTEGTWYWRVLPKYGFDSSFKAQASDVSIFQIKKTQEAEKPKLLHMKKVMDTSKGKGLTFSWKPNLDAAKYRVKIARDKAMSDVLINDIVITSYLDLKEASKLLPNGEYFMTVASLDAKENEIGISDVASFITMDSEIILRAVFPPNDYSLLQPLTGDAFFTWKSNFDSEQFFQVSDTEDFKKLTVNKSTKGLGVDGIVLPEGKWYWRVCTELDGKLYTSDIKKLNVIPLLDKPELENAKKSIVIVPGRKSKFNWKPIEGADYYQVKLTDRIPGSKPFYEDLYASKTEIEIAMGKFEDGDYILNIQAFANATLTSSRKFGLSQAHGFTAKHLKPVELLKPAEGEKIDGIEAALNPSQAEWSSVHPPVGVEFILEKVGVRAPVFALKDAGYKVQLPPLASGKYRWKVIAETEDGFDISSEKYSAFTVLPIPPLPKARFVFPGEKEVLGIPFFSSHRSIVFKWKPVDKATHYVMKIYNEKNKVIASTEIKAKSGAEDLVYEFKDLSRLSRGAFFIEVIAERRLDSGLVFQTGTPSRIRFDIDLPKKDNVETDETGVLYGR
ncbi:FecR domain-containing protein [Treponema denticola]|uniref:FecR domain-containing protein n=1 Tax=Treponema denticola TaxID=158 RepID=A0A9Q9EW91_TREDN|nr:FecR domain-containing protein [Treponema denticola]UTC90886.1 FecR domain-containing protein [Treponema denticola]UTC99762.1 FecR domain-containing protein [Treponema denticola]